MDCVICENRVVPAEEYSSIVVENKYRTIHVCYQCARRIITIMFNRLNK